MTVGSRRRCATSELLTRQTCSDFSSSLVARSRSVPAGTRSVACTTTSVKGLSVQLIAEIQCLQPGSFTELNIANTDMAPAVFPYLQTPAATALAKVAAA